MAVRELWVVLLLHGAALYLFTSGFFLTRYEATDVSPCSEVDAFSTTQHHLRHHATTDDRPGCWSNVKFRRVVYVVIDALRFDFMHEASRQEMQQKAADGGKYFLNHLPHVHELLRDEPSQSLLFRFVADAPTMTMQRLKGLTTGSLPTFLDIKDNMNSDEIAEDNWIKQLGAMQKKVVFMGDDTWDTLYPGAFLRKYSYDSFNVKDLHTVDNGVLDHFFPELETRDDWDVLIAHFLGVDHVGHTFGPNHPAMESKLAQMNAFLRDLTAKLPDDTLAVVLGDHGMSTDGNHGGATDDETGAALFLYSKSLPLHAIDPATNASMYTTLVDASDSAVVAQVDLLPSLSLLMGLPIPFGNLGAVIPHLFFLSSSSTSSFDSLEAMTRLNDALRVNAHQLRHFFLSTQSVRMDLPAMAALEALFNSITSDDADVLTTHRRLRRYLRDALDLSRSLYTQFDLVCMAHGVAILLLASLCLHAPLRSLSHLVLGVGVGAIIALVLPASSPLPHAPLPRVVATASLVAPLFGFCLPSSLPSLVPSPPFLLVLLHWLSLFSNSYLVVQDKLLLFLGASALAALGIDLLRRPRSSSSLAPFLVLCLLHRLYASWPVPNIVHTAVTAEFTVLPMLALGVVVYALHPPSLVSYAAIWLYWLDTLPLVLPWVVYAWTAVHSHQLASVLLVFTLVLGPSSPGAVVAFVGLVHLYCKLARHPNPYALALLMHSFYFQTGHGNSFASLQNAAGFVGLAEFHTHIAGALLALNTFGALWVALHFVPPAQRHHVLAYFSVSALCTTVFVGLQRRHLMVWAIFAPKYIFDGVMLLVVNAMLAINATYTAIVTHNSTSSRRNRIRDD
ncbi:Aste57867_5222 [Aphanomyces stellatus]|uniref:Aste57867_5222 protein n=1 Tax=Aphanomyces stellatus TaxID=120398 RepID=A0A485KED0_9STRA|nr:hypothetical protein As57867_005209 [Aphanomyces stellatus]VFT82295.1 Aste57867_5222 [Aphanomyces stellatus]